MNTKWSVAPVPSFDDVTKMCEATNTNRLVSAILCVRGFSPEEGRAFIKKDESQIYDPFILKDMDKAVNRINKAIKDGEKITIYGDYDADGVTSSTILILCIRELGGNVDYYIPDRENEGYGISESSIDIIANNGTKLIVSVDCGITAVDECEYAKEKGIDMVITDHHECSYVLPDACAVVDTKQDDCKYPFKMLSGVGVALKLCQALLKDKYTYIETLDKYADFAAIGSIADIVPLTNENRIICCEGLKKIQQSPKTGVKALLDISGIDAKSVNATKIGYLVAPKINAAGRLQSAQRAVDLFLENDYEKAYLIAEELNGYNIERQNIEIQILKEAEKLLLSKYKDDPIAVLCNEEWHHGVVGIVSSRLTKKYVKPCILLSKSPDGFYKGSGRSVEGFSLYDALDYTKDTLITFGGHELAVGLTLEKENINKFREEINKYAKDKMPDDISVLSYEADCELRGRHLNLDTVNSLSCMQPFGTGNQQPLFYINNMVVQKVYCIGNDKQHLKLTLSKDGVLVDAIAFEFGRNNKITFNDTISVMCHLDINEYRGVKNVQLRIVDIK